MKLSSKKFGDLWNILLIRVVKKNTRIKHRKVPFIAPASSALGLYLQQAVLSLLATRPVAQAHKLPLSAVQVSAVVTQGDAVVQAVPIFATETSRSLINRKV